MAGRWAFPMFWMMMILSVTLLGLRFTSMPVRQQEHVLLQLQEAFAAFQKDPVNYTQDFFQNSEYANNVLLVIVALTCKLLANGLRRREGVAAPAATRAAVGKKKK